MSLTCKISLIVDYAHEPESIKQVLQTLKSWKEKKFFDFIVHVVSCDARGRDDWKKPVMGKLSLEYADFSLVTTENYDTKDDPQQILDLLTESYPKDLQVQNWKHLRTEILKGKKFWRQTNRQTALLESLQVAKTLSDIRFSQEQTPAKVIVCATGHGHETVLLVNGKKTEWNEVKGWQKIFKDWLKSLN